MPLVFTLFPYVKMEHFNWDVTLNVMFMVLCVGMGELRNVPQNFYIICKVLVMMPSKVVLTNQNQIKSCWVFSILWQKMIGSFDLLIIFLFSVSKVCLSSAGCLSSSPMCWRRIAEAVASRLHCTALSPGSDIWTAPSILSYTPHLTSSFAKPSSKSCTADWSTKTAWGEAQDRVVIMREPLEYYLLKNDREKWMRETMNVTEMTVWMRQSPRKSLWQV